MRAVLVGCGEQSRDWVGYLPAGSEIVGFVDLNLAAAQRLAGRSGIPTGTDLAAMLRQVGPDVVFDCTVPAARLQVARTAFAAGCHVLAEKPMAETFEQARGILEAAEAAGRVYAVSQNYRYEAGARALRRMLPELGTLTTLHSELFVAPHFGGFRDAMAHPLLGDMAIHSFDTARFLRTPTPWRSTAHEWNPAGLVVRRRRLGRLRLRDDRRRVFTLRGSWCAEGLNTSWSGRWRADRRPRHGDVGRRRRAGRRGRRGDGVGWLSTLRAIEPAPTAGEPAGGRAVLAAFAAALSAGRTPETVGSDNIKCLAMVDRGDRERPPRRARGNRRLSWPVRRIAIPLARPAAGDRRGDRVLTGAGPTRARFWCGVGGRRRGACACVRRRVRGLRRGLVRRRSGVV